jgi:hypothetical protein
MKNRTNLAIFTTMLSVLACIGLAYGAVGPETPDPSPRPVNSNTADGYRAVENSDNNFNSGFGWFSLFSNTDAAFNSGFGAATLFFNNGNSNTAVGAAALFFNTTGGNNNAVGVNALRDNDSGFYNNAHGQGALFSNVDGSQNNAMGDLAMLNNTSGSANTAVGDDALFDNDTGDSNVAIGDEAGNAVTSGSENTFVGKSAGAGATTTLTGNIYLGVRAGVGVGNEIAFIRIGETTPPVVYDTFVQGIYLRPVGPAPLPVSCASNGKLTANPSSRRFKHDIKPIDKGTEAILALKPVTFKYNGDDNKNIDGTDALDFGLVAEEVDEVSPDLVIRDQEGKPLSVHYQGVSMMLLSEFIKEHKKVEELQATVAQQQKGMEVLTAQLKEQAAQIQKVSAQLEVSKPTPQVVANKP